MPETAGVQLCLAYRNEGGRVIVVLSLVPKTEMEETFRFIIPDGQRFGSTFVFRQGNPLLPDALRMIAAPAASATVIVSDTSRQAPRILSFCLPDPGLLCSALFSPLRVIGAIAQVAPRSVS